MGSVNIVKTPIVNNAMMNSVQNMINHFEKYNFVKKNYKGILEFGFNTENLLQIIRKEWLLTNMVLFDHPAFIFKSLKTESHFKNAFEMVKSLVTSVPFSFVEVDTVQSNKDISSESTNAMDLVRNSFKNYKETILRNQTLCFPETSIEFFHKQQRERKIWWRKFSALPGRFKTTQISINKIDKSQYVEIQAEFPWGCETVEVIEYFPEKLTQDPCFYEVKNYRQKVVPHVVSCETFLETIALTYLCDSYEGMNDKHDREILRFCRKLAPYKVSFAANSTSLDSTRNLKDLTVLLAKKLRKSGISVLLLPDVCSSSLERQILRNDGMGIPYTILLNDRTLRDGIIEIRSRDTTLKEQSHVSLITSYMEKLLKNY